MRKYQNSMQIFANVQKELSTSWAQFPVNWGIWFAITSQWFRSRNVGTQTTELT